MLNIVLDVSTNNNTCPCSLRVMLLHESQFLLFWNCTLEEISFISWLYYRGYHHDHNYSRCRQHHRESSPLLALSLHLSYGCRC